MGLGNTVVTFTLTVFFTEFIQSIPQVKTHPQYFTFHIHTLLA